MSCPSAPSSTADGVRFRSVGAARQSRLTADLNAHARADPDGLRRQRLVDADDCAGPGPGRATATSSTAKQFPTRRRVVSPTAFTVRARSSIPRPMTGAISAGAAADGRRSSSMSCMSAPFPRPAILLARSAHLDHLRRLGATAIELMPIAEFPGGRNWGYDGAFPFAPVVALRPAGGVEAAGRGLPRPRPRHLARRRLQSLRP